MDQNHETVKKILHFSGTYESNSVQDNQHRDLIMLHHRQFISNLVFSKNNTVGKKLKN